MRKTRLVLCLGLGLLAAACGGANNQMSDTMDLAPAKPKDKEPIRVGSAALDCAAPQGQAWGPYFLFGQRVTLEQPGLVQRLGFRAMQDDVARLALYTDDRGRPGELVAQTGKFTVSATQGEAPVKNPTQIEAGTYWIAIGLKTGYAIEVCPELTEDVFKTTLGIDSELPSDLGGYIFPVVPSAALPVSMIVAPL